jgi:hypothetical protein
VHTLPRTAAIALWLGHEQLATAHIYLHGDMSQKERRSPASRRPAPRYAATAKGPAPRLPRPPLNCSELAPSDPPAHRPRHRPASRHPCRCGQNRNPRPRRAFSSWSSSEELREISSSAPGCDRPRRRGEAHWTHAR